MRARVWLRVSAVTLWLCAGSLALAQGVPFGPSMGQQASAGTTPITIFGSKLVSWYRADLLVTGSAPVTAWGDSSGNAHNLTGSGSPALVTDSGVQAIDFETGTSDYFYRTLAGEPTTTPLAFYAVADMESTASRALASINVSGDTNNRWTLGHNSSPAATMLTRGNGTNGLATHGTTLSTATRYVFYGAAESTTSRTVNVDQLTSVNETTSKAPLGTPDRVAVGSDRGDAASNTWDGKVFEVVILNAAPSAGETTSYLAYADAHFAIPGITFAPPIWDRLRPLLPPTLGGAGLALALLSLRRPRRAGRLLSLPTHHAARRAA